MTLAVVILIIWIGVLLYMTRPITTDEPYKPQNHFERPEGLQPREKIGV